MKSTGITRKIDNLGRIVMPKELRDTMGVKEGDSMEFFVDKNKVIITKYVRGCHCCNNSDVVAELFGVGICDNCLNDFIQAREIIDNLR